MKCPGQDTQYWTAGAIFEVPCPGCGATVEFFKDDTSRRCGRCGQRFINPNLDFGCAAYCSFAEQCLGDLPPELVAQKEDLLKDRVAVAVKRHLKNDFKTIGKASRRARQAEEIGRAEQVNLAVVLMAAYLWDLGAGERAANGQGAATARALLAELKAPEPLIARVCDLLVPRPLSASAEAGIGEYDVVWDAEAIVTIEEKKKSEAIDPDRIRALIEQQCRTGAGRRQASKVLL